MFIPHCQAVFTLIIPLSLTKYSIIWNISNVVLTSQALGHAPHTAAATAAAAICAVWHWPRHLFAR